MTSSENHFSKPCTMRRAILATVISLAFTFELISCAAPKDSASPSPARNVEAAITPTSILTTTTTNSEATGAAFDPTGFFFKQNDFFVVRAALKTSLLDTLIRVMPDNLRYARALASAAENALQYRLDTRSRMSDGDVVALVFKEGDSDEVLRLAGMRYASRLTGREYFAYSFWEMTKPRPEFFDEEGVAYIPGLDRPPIPNERVAENRAGKSPTHNGVEFREQEETDVIAPFKSRVERINWLSKDEGRSVELEYLGTGVYASFTGLVSLSVKINPGAEVPLGAVIGRTGGPKTGPMHYTLRTGPEDDAPRVDPFQFHGRTQYRISTSERGAFTVVQQKIDALFKEADERATANSEPRQE